MWKYFVVALLLIANDAFGASLNSNLDDLGSAGRQDGRIVGGRVEDVTKLPYQVSLRRKVCPTCEYSHSCGGSIFNELVIVTAAHCVNGRAAENFIIVAGTNRRNGADGAVARVAKIVIHEEYDSAKTNNDVALMFLDTPLPVDGVRIAPIRLASKAPVEGSHSIISGWGTTASGGYSSDQLMAADVPIVSNKRCEEAYAVTSGPGRITDSMICAGVDGVGGKDSCQGDSGGPLVVNKELAGIVSWGRGCGLPDFPGVYANVAYLRDWILKNIKANTST